ncbi:MAG TPA: sigma-70 family RNA polymerase sigma factor [Blastocatellia bacterium]|jgi:RNA polymerase sigma factor (TIGR02999 family)
MASAGVITLLLRRWTDGDKSAADELMPLVYDELRRIAVAYFNRERRNTTLEPTALVHEAYLRLVDQEQMQFQCRAQFFALAARLMRNILVDRARERDALKRGGDHYRVSLSKVDRLSVEPDVDLISLDDAMNELAELNERHSQIVELRFFGGLTIEETAEALGISHATVEREWRFARAWLHRRLSA